MAPLLIAGVDGCKGGWLVALAAGWPCPAAPELRFCPNFPEVLELTAACVAVAVDVPIGLPAPKQWPRQCDEVAREMLRPGNGANRVFRAPPREAMDSVDDYEAFSAHHARLVGDRPSTQLWGFAKKSIRDADEAMSRSPALQKQLVEAHPELAWKSLAGRVLASKHTARGLLERLAALQPHVPGLMEMSSPPAAAKTKLDDLLDALTLLAVAAHVAEVGVKARPEDACRVPKLSFSEIPKDTAKKLRMEIWY